jgi:subtilisin family serine protease
VTVAVVDSGVNAGHPDLKGAVLTGRDMVSGKDGRFDAEGHGTAMAGIIAARGRRRCRLPRVSAGRQDPSGHAVGRHHVRGGGIRWAAAHGAKVINCPFAIGPSDNLHAAIREAAAADVVLVGAAGNTGNKGNKAEYPSAIPRCSRRGRRPERHGAAGLPARPQVDLVAPARTCCCRVRQQVPDGYGTSGSAAIVSGAAALIRPGTGSQRGPGGADPHRHATDRWRAGRDDFYGNGELNLLRRSPRHRPARRPPRRRPRRNRRRRARTGVRRPHRRRRPAAADRGGRRRPAGRRGASGSRRARAGSR